MAPLQGFNRQLDHLLNGIDRIVGLMLSETNAGHPHVEHLKRVRMLLQRGQALQKELFSFVKGEGSPVIGQRRASAAKGSGVVLLVDHEKAVRQAGRQLLAAAGYTVFAASDEREALQIYFKNRGNIDVVVMDMGVPGVNGKAAVERMKKADPKIQVLLSGVHREENAQNVARGLGCQGFIRKPFSEENLVKAIKTILQGIRV